MNSAGRRPSRRGRSAFACSGAATPGDGRLSAPMLAQRLRHGTAADGEAFSHPLSTACSPRPGRLRLPGPVGRANRLGGLASALRPSLLAARRRNGGLGGGRPCLSGLARIGPRGDRRRLSAAAVRQPCRITPVAAARRHPILSGVEPLVAAAGWPPSADLAADATVLLTAAAAAAASRWPGSAGSRPGLFDHVGRRRRVPAGRLLATAGQCGRLDVRRVVTPGRRATLSRYGIGAEQGIDSARHR